VDNCVLLLLERLQEISASGNAFDVGNWLQCYAFDVIGEITFSKRFGLLDKGEDQTGLINAIHTSLAYTNRWGLYSWLHPYAWWFQNFFQSKEERFIGDFVRQSLREHLAGL
jgi:hypothetical protein